MIKAAWSAIHVMTFMVLAGCSFSHQVSVQDDFTAEAEDLPRISSTGPVAIDMQTQKPSGSIELCKAGGRTYYADYGTISDFALSSAGNILERNGVEVSDSAEKRLTIIALDGTCKTSGLLLNFIMDMTVKTGDGRMKDFSGYQKMMHLPERDFALSAATLNVVLGMFSDPEIQQYLKE